MQIENGGAWFYIDLSLEIRVGVRKSGSSRIIDPVLAMECKGKLKCGKQEGATEWFIALCRNDSFVGGSLPVELRIVATCDFFHKATFVWCMF